MGKSYRALGIEVENGILWFWIGTHAEYDRLNWQIGDRTSARHKKPEPVRQFLPQYRDLKKKPGF